MPPGDLRFRRHVADARYALFAPKCRERVQILEGSTVHTDGWKACDGLIVNGYDHDRVFHGANEFARGKSHVNGIESFWSYAKHRLAKFNGCKSENFVLHLEECEFRFNHRNENLQKIIRKLRDCSTDLADFTLLLRRGAIGSFGDATVNAGPETCPTQHVA